MVPVGPMLKTWALGLDVRATGRARVSREYCVRLHTTEAAQHQNRARRSPRERRANHGPGNRL
jgi:hypothetical protein